MLPLNTNDASEAFLSQDADLTDSAASVLRCASGCLTGFEPVYDGSQPPACTPRLQAP